MQATAIGDPGVPAFTVARDQDWLSTIRQSLPVMTRVLRALRPTWELPDVLAFDADFLHAAGIRGLLWDIDGTLMHRHAAELHPGLQAGFDRLLREPSLQHAIVSNCGEARYRQLAQIFPTVPVVKAYAAQGGPVFRTLRGSTESWSAPPQGVLRPLRKPDPLVIECALRTLGIDERPAVALVGDQYLTDVAAANLAGIRSIKVRTVGLETFPAGVRVLQRADDLLHRLTR